MDDTERIYPGDELIPDAPFMATRSIEIECEPSVVWPWLVQMGYQRAGWYIDAWWDSGFVGGLQIGKNWQAGKIVYGIEGDLSLSGTDGIDWVGTLRGRLGYLVNPSILVYGTAGLGFIDFEFGGNETEFVYGLGVEGRLTEATTLRLEYVTFNDTDVDIVRLGVNWKLNW